jgi:hypothetical protein
VIICRGGRYRWSPHWCQNQMLGNDAAIADKPRLDLLAWSDNGGVGGISAVASPKLAWTFQQLTLIEEIYRSAKGEEKEKNGHAT